MTRVYSVSEFSFGSMLTFPILRLFIVQKLPHSMSSRHSPVPKGLVFQHVSQSSDITVEGLGFRV